MTFVVRWKRSARDQLANIWIQGPDRRAVTLAANRIDDLLQVNPETRGESRGKERRILLEPPLGVVFKVVPEDQVVFVLAVWRFNRRS